MNEFFRKAYNLNISLFFFDLIRSKLNTSEFLTKRLTFSDFFNSLFLKFMFNKTTDNNLLKFYICFSFVLASTTITSVNAQLITGVWKGKIDHKNVEVKIIKNGDSLTGTSYYYQSPNIYRRYSIKGYFDNSDNSVVWWDDQLIEEKNSSKFLSVKNYNPYRSVADFNCPGGTKMYLTGKASLKNDEVPMKLVALQKFDDHIFNDEWDFIIANYLTGANDPRLIDSIGKLAFAKPKLPETSALAMRPDPPRGTGTAIKQPESKVIIPAKTEKPVVTYLPEKKQQPVVAMEPLTNQQKFESRKKQVIREIPVSGDSIELRFYDNAIVDGDSIAIFLNNQLLAEHIRLTEKAYTIKLAVSELHQSNELAMVAENLGSIPPNTSLMVAIVDGQRYETRLESSEESSAVIRFVRKEQ